MTAMERERRVDQFLLRELGKESEIREATLGPFDEVSWPMRFLFRRMVELHWTTSRLIRNLRELVNPRSRRVTREESDRRLYSSTALPKNNSPRILLDMTDAYRTGKATGIQRVVREVARHAAETGQGLPIIIEDGKLLPYYHGGAAPEVVSIREGDIFVMLDATWNDLATYRPIMRKVTDMGGVNVVCLYDLLPLMFPQAFSPTLIPLFEHWFDHVLTRSDAVVAISQSAAQDLVDYLAANPRELKKDFRIGWWRLGADFSVFAKDDESDAAKSLCSGAPFFLSIGTVEPRKAYPVALDAFEQLWGAGQDVRYAIVGRKGWSARHTTKRILEHPEFGRRLFWFDNAGDADLNLLYKHARAVIAPSFAEGFGLPIVEAARHGLPTIASDIPVFREVGGDAVAYFDCLDSRSLAGKIDEFLRAPKAAPNLPETSWRQSTDMLMSLIRERAYQISPKEHATAARGR